MKKSIKRKDPYRFVGIRKINQEIIRFIEYRNRTINREYPIYEILCHNCGNKYESFYPNFSDKRKTGKVCRKCSNTECRDYSVMSASDAQISIVYSNYKSKCKIKNWEFNLNKEQFTKLVRNNCHYCNQKPNKSRLDRVKNIREMDSSFLINGIDRLNSSIGYSIDNCVACCEDCNKAKRNLSYDQFINLIKRIYEFKIKK